MKGVLVVVVHPPTFPVYRMMSVHGGRIWASEPTAEVRQSSRSRALPLRLVGKISQPFGELLITHTFAGAQQRKGCGLH
jgi:hypothetical protein